MKTSSHFSSRTSALVLGSILIASLGVAGVALAQLNIPTNLSNAAITIQRIFLSAGGVSTNDTVANIILDGINGNITTKPENVLTP